MKIYSEVNLYSLTSTEINEMLLGNHAGYIVTSSVLPLSYERACTYTE